MQRGALVACLLAGVASADEIPRHGDDEAPAPAAPVTEPGLPPPAVVEQATPAEGEVIETKPVPEFTDAQIEEAFAHYHGDFHQMPPMVSAIKIDGVPLYKLARKGQEVERQPRLVTVFHHQIKRIALPDVGFRVVCSKGFYVRTYCHDIGAKLGCGGHLAGLRRTRSGKFTVEGNLTFDELKTLPREQILSRILSLRDVSRLRGA